MTHRPSRVRIEARAKLNLGLAVGPRRPDGYHDLATVFQSIALADTLELRRRPSGFRLRVCEEDAALARGDGSARARKRAPRGRDNLVLRAARLLHRRLGLPGGAEITLIKRIPLEAGLGGGSADAAATLVGIARLHGRRPGAGTFRQLALELGSDVPFALRGGTAVGFGRGEDLHPTRLTRGFRVLVAQPEWGVSTARAYQRIEARKYGLTAWGAKLRFAQSLVRDGVNPRHPVRLGNTFEQVLGERTREFESLCGRLRACGLESPRMTGSGSAVFAIAPRGLSLAVAAAHFEGRERLFATRSVATALRVTTFR